jgi:hypothetical protein
MDNKGATLDDLRQSTAGGTGHGEIMRMTPASYRHGRTNARTLSV